jgi:hypothetical protein
MDPKEALRTKLLTESPSFLDLDPPDRALLATVLRPPSTGFTLDQRAYMADFYLLAPDLSTLETLNQNRPHHLTHFTSITGEILVPVDTLTDMRPRETLHHAAHHLTTWPIVFRPPSSLTQPTMLE